MLEVWCSKCGEDIDLLFYPQYLVVPTCPKCYSGVEASWDGDEEDRSLSELASAIINTIQKQGSFGV